MTRTVNTTHKNKHPMVTVVMPCFNDGEYIQESIDSVLAQTYPEFELIIIDDGSTDHKTVEIISELKHEKIKILHSTRQRPAGARNLGISNARGEYILPVDSDDLIEPDYIEKAVAIIEADSTIGAVYCRADLFGEKSGPWDLPNYSLSQMLLDNIVFVTALFRRKDWEKVGGFSTEMQSGMEDYDFWLSILELGLSIHQIPEVLFHYRIKPVSRTTNFLDNEKNVQEIYKKIYFRHPTLYEKYRDEYAIVLREALISQLFLNSALRKSIALYDKLVKIPILRFFVKKIVGKE